MKAMSCILSFLILLHQNEWLPVFIYLTFQKESIHFSAHCLPYFLFPREKSKVLRMLTIPTKMFPATARVSVAVCHGDLQKPSNLKGCKHPKHQHWQKSQSVSSKTPPPLTLVMKLRPREEEWQGQTTKQVTNRSWTRTQGSLLPEKIN